MGTPYRRPYAWVYTSFRIRLNSYLGGHLMRWMNWGAPGNTQWISHSRENARHDGFADVRK